MKTKFRAAIAGALIGVGLFTWVAPKVISWWFVPPAQIGINCQAPVEWAINRFQIAQAIGLVLGAILGISVTFVFRRNRPQTLTPQ